MGTINPGFWICRFLIVPEEFAVFAKKCHEHKHQFFFVQPSYKRPIISIEKVILQYGITYNNIIFQTPVALYCGIKCTC